MIDFSKLKDKPRSEVGKWLDKYKEKFGESYPMQVCGTNLAEEEVINDIKKSIEFGIKKDKVKYKGNYII